MKNRFFLKGILRKAVCVYVIVCYFSSSLFAQTDKQREISLLSFKSSFSVYYPVSKTYIDEGYLSNRENLSQIKDYLKRSPRIDSIVIYSFSSPDGSYSFNSVLAKKRGITARDYLLDYLKQVRNEVISDSLIHLKPTAENWDGLREEIDSLYFRADRDEVLAIIDRPDLVTEQKKQALKRLDGGQSWTYILRHCMPQLRHATWLFVWGEPTPRLSLLPALPETKRLFAPSLPKPGLLPIRPLSVLPPADDTRTLFALKTNLLYDLGTLLNLSVEVPFQVRNRHFSVVVQHQFPWWLSDNNRHCLRFLSTGVEGRWWFKPMFRDATEKRLKRDALMGHFVGVYALSGKWDFQWNRKGCYQGEFWSVGLDYGYSMPLGKRCNLEFTIALGYASIPYRHYIPSEDWETLYRDYDDEGIWNYFGPTRAEISLVVPIFKKWKKGGKR